MAVQNFVIDLIEELLRDEELTLTEQDIRFYDKGTTVDTDETLDDHIRWRNARYFNEDSNVIRSSSLIIQLNFEKGTEYINFHVGELYRTYRKDGMKKVLPIVKENIQAARVMAGQKMALVEHFVDYESIKEHLIIRPLNYDNNTKVLAKGIYRQIGDMALVLYISLGKVVQKKARNILSTMVLQEIFQIWNMDEETVFQEALENTMRLQPPVFCDITVGLGSNLEAKHIRFMDDQSVQIDFDSPLAPALTTEQEINGAIAAFYPGVLERLYQMIGEDFYLVFSGIYDVHIHPINGKFSVSSMRTTLADMNRNANRRDELLSRQIYRYSGETKELTVVR